MSLGLSRIGQIALSVRDMARAVAFYRDVLGLRFMFEAPNVAFFDCAGQRLMLGQTEASAPKPSGTVLYFDSADLDADHARLLEAAVPCRAAPHRVAPLGDKQLWMAFYSDADDNTFALTQLR